MRTRVYFITDVHGSDRCFRKFLNAVGVYQADVIILGGDVTGKSFTPIVDGGDGTFRCTYQGSEVTLNGTNELEQFTKKAADYGTYTKVVSTSEFAELESDRPKLHAVFSELMLGRMRDWMALAEERLGKSSVRCYISPGNDDILELDPILDSSKFVVNPEGKVVQIDGEHEMITLGYTNHTPWNSPREVDEVELGRMISLMAENLKSPKSSIFNIHVPPINTLIDQAPKIDKELRPVLAAGTPQMISAGSTACREAITKYQPMLGLHGHIHESRGVVKLGRTMCANPGSEYGEGILRGFVTDIEGEKVKTYLFTSG